jgi:dsDNA-specific endonuclease/ATPase MutS2
MSGEISLLEQVRVKELELKETEDQARIKAEQIIAESKNEASEIVRKAQAEGERQAEQERIAGKQRLSEDLTMMRTQAISKREEVRVKGEGRIDAAAKIILERVAFT